MVVLFGLPLQNNLRGLNKKK
jgi:hypothetical protein